MGSPWGDAWRKYLEVSAAGWRALEIRIPLLISDAGPITSARDMKALLGLESPPPIMSGTLSSISNISEAQDESEDSGCSTCEVQVCMLLLEDVQLLKDLTEHNKGVLCCFNVASDNRLAGTSETRSKANTQTSQRRKGLGPAKWQPPRWFTPALFLSGMLETTTHQGGGNHLDAIVPILISDDGPITLAKQLRSWARGMESKATTVEVVKKRYHIQETGDETELDRVQVCLVTQRDMDKLGTVAVCRETVDEGVWLDGAICPLVIVKERKEEVE